MSEVDKRRTITFEPEELRVALACVGAWAPQQITAAGLDADAFAALYAALSEVAWGELFEDVPSLALPAKSKEME